MSEQVTQNMDNGRPFEERVFARFDALDARLDSVDARLNGMDVSLRDMDARLLKLEARSYDTKPIWEQALKEIADTRREVSKRLDRIESVVLQNRSEVHDLEERVEKLESKLTQ